MEETVSKTDNTDTKAVEKPAKKSFFKNLFKKITDSLAGVFRDYPVTMASILVAALFAAILVHLDYKDKDVKETCEKIMQFAFWMGAQSFVIEEIFRKKLLPKICSFVFAVLFSSAFVFMASYEGSDLFGLDFEMLSDIWLKVCVVYGTIISALAIYHIYRRLGQGFEEYCTRSFLTLLRSYVLYGLFAIGLAVIIYIFSELIFDTGDFLECSEVFLATGFIAAMTIRAVSSAHEKCGRFAKICVMYALLPMLLIAYAIIYIYMIKIFVTDDVPSNSVFRILAGLFSVGVPIWTMAHDIGSDRKGFGKISFIVPYIYIPFIFLQIWSLGIRIGQYGLTSQRYFGIVLIIFEILYFILYACGQILKKDLIFILLFLFMTAAPICAFIPRICYDDAVIASQLKRAKNILTLDDPSAPEKRQLSSAYHEIRNIGYKGKKISETAFTAKEKDLIKDWDENGYDSYAVTEYLRDDNRLGDLDISDYRRISETGYINWEYGDIKDHPYEVHFSTSDDDDAEYAVNLEGLVKHAVSQYDEGKKDTFELGNFSLIKIDAGNDLYIKEITFIYNEEEPEKTEIRFSGYVLKR
ncbi:MAG: DUF4153 domain-containing protein [Lachnospiraceae bacterium]|nr:DUF4153 domain-containing protein [Lachnospiraceae bacterium]